jgi:hypothetical protein
MSWSREEALTDPVVVKPMRLLCEFRFSLRDIPTEIVVRLYQPIHSIEILARRSHDIVVEGIQAPVADCGDSSSEGEVLHAAVNELITSYNAARAKGLKPEASWLKPNPDF